MIFAVLSTDIQRIQIIKPFFSTEEISDWLWRKKSNYFYKCYKNTFSRKKQVNATATQQIHLSMHFIGEGSTQLDKARKFFRKYLKELVQLAFIHRPDTIADHCEHKDKQAHLQHCNAVHKFKRSFGHSHI